MGLKLIGYRRAGDPGSDDGEVVVGHGEDSASLEHGQVDAGRVDSIPGDGDLGRPLGWNADEGSLVVPRDADADPMALADQNGGRVKAEGDLRESRPAPAAWRPPP